jgi:glycolate oxidase
MTQLDTIAALADLAAELPADALTTDPAALPGRNPLALVRATDPAHVEAVLRWATRYATPVVTIGTGSRLPADVIVEGAIVISADAMSEIRTNEDGTITAQAGARTADVLAAATAAGGWLPLTPGPSTTIGGDVATATPSGFRALDLVDHIVELRIALPDRPVIRAAGMEDGGPMALVNLFAGSRGQLGVVTEVTLRPTPLPARAAILAAFADATTAADAALEVLTSAWTAEVQLLSRLALAGPTSFQPSDAGAVLMIACDPSDTAAVENVGMAFGADQITVCAPGAEAVALLGHGATSPSALTAVAASLPRPLSVQPTRLAEFLARTRAVERAHGASLVVVANVDSGWVSPFAVHNPDDAAAAATADTALFDLLDVARELAEESIGEGDGQVHRGWTARALGVRGRDTDRRMKLALDPRGLLNPGLAY